MKSFLKNFALLFITVAITLLLAEAAVRIFYPQEMTGSLKVLSDYGYDLNRSHGTVMVQYGKYRKIYYHFYPPALRDTKINPKAIPILAMGDSVTFGWLLPLQKTFIYQLQQRLNQQFGDDTYQILNAASGGRGVETFLAYLKQFGALTHPKYVLIFINSDDIGRALELDIYRLKNQNGLELVDHYHPYPHAKLKRFLDSDFYNFLLAHSQLAQLSRNVFLGRRASANSMQAYIDAHPRFPNRGEIFQRNLNSQQQLTYAVQLGKAIFYNIHLWCQQHHAKLLVVTTGYNAFYRPGINDPTKEFLTQAPVFFKEQGIPYYDIAPEFEKAVAGRSFQVAGDSHPNAYGAHVIASLVWPWLKDQVK